MNLHGKILAIGLCLAMKAPLLFAQSAFLELNLSSQAMRGAAFPAAANTCLDVFRVIERAAGDDRIKGIVLNVSAFSAGHEALWELRQALEEFRATGKKIVAFVGAANLSMYFLATVADRIVMDDQGTLLLLGHAWGRGYARRGLGMLGVGARELRFFEYKSAAETFTRDCLSDADRRQYGAWLDDVMAVTRGAITQARGWSDEEFYAIINGEFLLSARAALARGIVDATGRRQAVIDAVMEVSGSGAGGNAGGSANGSSGAGGEIANGIAGSGGGRAGRRARGSGAGAEPAFVVFGDAASSITGGSRLYGPGRLSGGARGGGRPPAIAVISSSGVTDMERGMAARALARTIDDLSQRRRVRAIVLRVNSPGGSAEAAAYIADAVTRARERVPVVVSMGAVAASGGYWASMSACHIAATPMTVTGSIGVIATWFYDSGLNDRLGLSVDLMQRGNHADLGAGIILPRRDLNEAELERFREYITDHYDIFVERVAASRGMEMAQAQAVAQGRIFSGAAALEAGLIDSIGGLKHAIRVARELAGIPECRGVVFEQYPRPTFLGRMMGRLAKMGLPNRLAARLPPPSAGAGMEGALSTALLMTELFLPAPILEDIRFRIAHNGRAMPMLPMDSMGMEMLPPGAR